MASGETKVGVKYIQDDDLYIGVRQCQDDDYGTMKFDSVKITKSSRI